MNGRKVPRLVHLVASTVFGFLGACGGLILAFALLSKFAREWQSARIIPCVLLGSLGGCFLSMFCVRAVLGRMQAPDSITEVEGGVFQATLAELKKEPGKSRTEFWPLLLGSLAIFTALGGLAGGVGRLVLLTAVLAFHEAGHLVAMRAFGYRDVRILFIPFLGAVTTGRQENVPGDRRAIVLLAGPLPGLLLGLGLSLVGATHDPLIGHTAGLLVAINAFNLLPLAALDGGKLLEALLFSRGPLLLGAFTMATSALLALFAYNRHAWLLLAVAWVGFSLAPRTYKIAQAARELDERDAVPESLADASPEFVRELFDAAYVKVVSPRVKRSSRGLAAVTANAMRDIHAQAVQRPASLPASVLLLTGYVAIFAVCTVTWLHRRSDVAMSQSWGAVRGASAHPTIQ